MNQIHNSCLCVTERDTSTKWCCDQDYEGRVGFSLHTKNVRLVRFVVKRRGCCCNLSIGVALNKRFTTNGMCAKNNTRIYVARTSNNTVISSGDFYCCLLPQCEALRTCRSGFPTATTTPIVETTMERNLKPLRCAISTCWCTTQGQALRG